MTFSLILKDEAFLEKSHCCEAMTEQANMYFPKATSQLLGSTDKRIYWSPIFNEYGLICQPSSELLEINYCPFCGKKLPASKRDQWFAKLEFIGWETWEDEIPDKFLTPYWQDA